MKVLGIDPSLTATGAAWLDDGRRATAILKSQHMGMARLADLRNQLLEHARAAHLVIVEGYSMGSARQQSQAHALGELGGVLRLALWEARIPYVNVAPATVKKLATGKGNALKDEVLLAAVRRLAYQGSSKDEADAMWLLEAGLHHYHLDGRCPLPQDHLAGLGKADWPTRKVLGVAEPLPEPAEAFS